MIFLLNPRGRPSAPALGSFEQLSDGNSVRMDTSKYHVVGPCFYLDEGKTLAAISDRHGGGGLGDARGGGYALD
jgi:hypothetical protein